MSLQTKIIACVIAVFCCYVAADYYAQNAIIFPRFVALERQKAGQDLRRSQEAIERELQHLSVACHDWAAWDEMYQYIETRGEEWATSNLSDTTMRNAQLNAMFIVTLGGEVVYGRILDVQNAAGLTLSAFPAGRWPGAHPLLAQPSATDAIETILVTEAGPMLVVSRAVVHTDGSGPPVGVLVFGRLVSAQMVDQLREQTRVTFDIHPLGPDAPASVRDAAAGIAHDADFLVRERGVHELEVQSVLVDHTGRPVLALVAVIPRDISLQGRGIIRFALLSVGIAGLGTTLLLLILLALLVGRPLHQLTEHVAVIGASGDLQRYLRPTRKDEFGVLGRAFDRMVEALAESRAQFAETSRRAGMADVASGILHNVGNVLNNVKTSTWVITDRVRHSRVAGLAKAAELLEQHAADVDTFVTRDSRGRQLPGYIIQLAGALAAEQEQMLGELEKLAAGVDHVNEIIQSQNRFARCSGHAEPTSIAEVVDRALSIMAPTFARHGIEVDQMLEELPSAFIDRSKLLQIVINLLTNAKHAMLEPPSEHRRLIVILRRSGPDAAELRVNDTGIGIAAENLSRIFANGFTTKTGGSGYGLHYSALSARQLGGTLEASSEGTGRGATFTLRIPLAGTADAQRCAQTHVSAVQDAVDDRAAEAEKSTVGGHD